MLTRRKLKSLEKEIKKISSRQMTGVFFVNIVDGDYVIQGTPSGNIVFQGDKESYKTYISKRSEAIFIVDDIPRSPDDTLSEWAR